MFRIENTIPELIEALEVEKPIKIKADYWWCENKWWSWLRKTLGLKNRNYLYLAQYLVVLLKNLEKIPVSFCQSTSKNTLCISLIVLGFLVVQKLIHQNECHFELLRYLLALEYRIEKKNGGINKLKQPGPEYLQLVEKAQKWKEQQLFFPHRLLTAKEIQKLKEISKYLEFTSLILKSSLLQQNLFNWSLRDNNPISVFIEYPGTQQLLEGSNLSARIGKVGEGRLLKIRKVVYQSDLIKVLTLPFEGVDRSILNPEEVIQFRGPYQLKLKEIYEVFKNKYYNVGKLEFFQEGFVNWNTLKLGWWDDDQKVYHPMDLSLSHWWKQLPLIEILDRKKAQQRYGNHLDHYHWIMAAAATRESPTLNYVGTHAYLEVAIPRREGGYAIYDFGKVATFFPSNTLETLKVFCLNLFAAVSYPDDNIFYTHRQQTLYAFPISPENGLKLMELIKQHILFSRDRNFVYQIESENCAKWVYECLTTILGKENVPNLFKMKLLQTEPVGPVSNLFHLIKKLPEHLQTPFLTFMHLPLGAYIGTWIVENGQKVRKAMTNHPFWMTGDIYLPALLHQLKEKGKLPVIRIECWNPSQYRKNKRLSFFNPSSFLEQANLAHSLIFINLLEKMINLSF